MTLTELNKMSLVVAIWDSDSTSRDDYIAGVRISLKEVQYFQRKELLWIELQAQSDRLDGHVSYKIIDLLIRSVILIKKNKYIFNVAGSTGGQDYLWSGVRDLGPEDLQQPPRQLHREGPGAGRGDGREEDVPGPSVSITATDLYPSPQSSPGRRRPPRCRPTLPGCLRRRSRG